MQHATAEPAADGRPERGRRPLPPRAFVLVPLLASLAVVWATAGRLDAPFTPAYDGFNTAVWATGARAVRADGWWDARLGGRADRVGYPESYAHHPPLTQVEASLAGTVVGDHRWAYRLAALISSIAAVWCCWGWLGACGFSPGPRSSGLLVAVGTPLLLNYGLMLNMEIVWLPLAFGLLWAWRRAEAAEGSGATACGALAVAGGLAAHQGILLAAGLGLLGLVRAGRGRRRPHGYEMATLGGAALGALGFLGWVWWVGGGLADLWRIASVRSDTHATVLDALRTQGDLTVVLFGVVGVAAAVAGLVLVRRRPELIGVEAVVVTVTVIYALAFRDGSTHVYWNAALLPAVALGAALVGERVGRYSTVALAAWVAVAAMVAAGGVLIAHGTAPDADYGLLARQAGTMTEELATTFAPSDWTTYESGARVREVRTCDQVRGLALTAPAAVVMTSADWVEDRGGATAWASVRDRAAARRGEVALLTAADLEAAAC